MSNICWIHLLKCKNVLLFFAIYNSKWRDFGFWTVSWRKEAISGHHFGLNVSLVIMTTNILTDSFATGKKEDGRKIKSLLVVIWFVSFFSVAWLSKLKGISSCLSLQCCVQSIPFISGCMVNISALAPFGHIHVTHQNMSRLTLHLHMWPVTSKWTLSLQHHTMMSHQRKTYSHFTKVHQVLVPNQIQLQITQQSRSVIINPPVNAHKSNPITQEGTWTQRWPRPVSTD